MTEPIFCSKCGGVHLPGACPQETSIPKTEGLLPEEKEKVELQGELEEALSQTKTYRAETIITRAKEQGVSLDLTRACQGAAEALLSADYRGHIQDTGQKLLPFVREKGITLDLSGACRKAIAVHLSKGDVFNAEGVVRWTEQKNISLDLANLSGICEKAVKNQLSSGSYDFEKKIEEMIAWAERRKVPLDLTNLRSLCQEVIEKFFSIGYTDTGDRLIQWAQRKGITLDTIDLPNLVQRGLKHCLSQGDWMAVSGDLSEWAKEKNIPLNFSEKEVAEAWLVGLRNELGSKRKENLQLVPWFFTLLKERNIPVDFSVPEVIAACEESLKLTLSDGNIDNIRDIYSVAKENGVSIEILNKLVIQTINEEFSKQSTRVFDILYLADEMKIPLGKESQLKPLSDFFKEYGRFVTFSLYQTHQDLASGKEPTQNLKSLGVFQTGEDSMRQLRKLYWDLKKDFDEYLASIIEKRQARVEPSTKWGRYRSFPFFNELYERLDGYVIEELHKKEIITVRA